MLCLQTSLSWAQAEPGRTGMFRPFALGLEPGGRGFPKTSLLLRLSIPPLARASFVPQGPF